MDPAVKAAHDLTAVFRQLEVPCEVKVSPDAGKFAVATRDLPEPGFTLVEELPIASWPTRSFLQRKLPLCFHCLRRERAGNADSTIHGSSSGNEKTIPSTEEGSSEDGNAAYRISWTGCALCASRFCCEACRVASRRTHLLLCSALSRLRDAELAADDGTAATSAGTVRANTGAAGAAGAAASAVASKAPKSYADEEGSITPEAVARCAAWLVARIASAIERQGLTAKQLGDAATGAALVHQLFTQAAAPFDRLIGAPDTADFAGIRDPKAWFHEIRALLKERCVKLLTLAANAANAAAGATGSGQADVAKGEDVWAGKVADAALSDDTLRTFLGQIVLNAHAVNDYELLDNGTVDTDVPAGKDTVDAVSMPVPGSANPTSIPHPHGGIRFAWVMKGAAVYSLLSTFNHSCEPNVAITCVDGTHEIAIQTTKPIACGEEFHNTYIPLREGSTAKERREQLKGYFFTCQCPRCRWEEDTAEK